MSRNESRHRFAAAYSVLFMVIGALVISGCKTKKADDGPGSATVQPADPSSIAPGSQASAGSAVPGTSSYVGTDAAPPSGSGVKTTYSGLQYEVLRPGTGQRPTAYNRVKVHYHGYLPDGTVFDSSVQRGQPATFGLNQVIAGWKEGIPLMREGAKYRFTVPPHLAYGARGMPPKIGPNQTLKFDVELFEVLY